MTAIDEICTITTDGQITLPKAVRRALGVDCGDQIAFRIENGAVVVSALVSQPNEDGALGPFLALLERDIQARPEALAPVSLELFEVVKDLAGQIDLDAAIEGDVDLDWPAGNKRSGSAKK